VQSKALGKTQCFEIVNTNSTKGAKLIASGIAWDIREINNLAPKVQKQ
jgi:hypothetical protein